MSKSLAAIFAKELKAARRARGLTQAEAAERVGVAIEVFGRLERGRALPRADTLVRAATALGVSTDALLGLGTGVGASLSGEPQAEYADRPELRRLLRRLENASPRTIRLLSALASSLERAPFRSRHR